MPVSAPPDGLSFFVRVTDSDGLSFFVRVTDSDGLSMLVPVRVDIIN